MMGRPFRAIFMGTPDFAVPSLQALAGDPLYEVALVVTQPDRAIGRKQILTPSPVKQAAQELGLPVLQPEKVRAKDVLDELAGYHPDVIVTAAYGQLLPQALLDIPTKGCLNIHASLLPRWRGAAPIHRSIMAGDERTGITIMEMVKALDAGPVVGVAETEISPFDTTGTVHDRLSQLGAELLLQVLPEYLEGRIQPVPQPEEGVCYAERILRQDEFLDWHCPNRTLHNHIRGLSPWPGTVAKWEGKEFKVWLTELVELPKQGTEAVPGPEAVPGMVKEVPSVGVCIKTGEGWLKLLEVQPAGKKRMNAKDWFRGIADGCTRLYNVEVDK